MNKIRWGVIGAGGIARRRTIPEGILAAGNSQLSCVFDVRDCDAIARQFNTRAARSVEDVLQSEIDAVYVATPVHHHLPQVLAAARAGRHVLCEKPLGLNPDEAQQMVRACESAGVKMGVGLMMRYHAQHVAARELLQSGQLGTPILARAQLSCWYPPIPGAWRQSQSQGGGGALMDLGAHCLDLLEYLLGPAHRVTCSVGRVVQDYEVEDSALVILEFARGAKGIVDCLFNVPDESSKNRLELYGSQGSILAEGTIGQAGSGEMKWHPRISAGGYDAAQARNAESARLISPAPVNLYRAQIEAFADAILNDQPPPVSGQDGLRNQKLLAACYESARTGRAVNVS